MTEQMYDDHDTQEITLPRGLPRLQRESFRQSPAANVNPYSVPPRTQPSLFEPIDRTAPEKNRGFELLMQGDVLKIPVPAYSENDQEAPQAVLMEEYTVKGLQEVDGKLMARIVNAAGIEEWIAADSPVTGGSLEGAIARQLIEVDGIDLHDPSIQIIEEQQSEKK